MSAESSVAVEVEDLSVRFVTRERTVFAVNHVSLALGQGEVLGVLGESGSGKSVTLKAMMRLLPPHGHVSGKVRIGGDELLSVPERRMEELRGRKISMIFQEPMTAFDPVFTIGQQISETILRHEGCSRRAAEKGALELLERVQIPSARQRLGNYPHEMSGGMRQRAMIALALSCKPSLLLADEPTTALDVTVQMQILLLLRELQREFGMAVIFVTHDIGVAFEISDRLAVMYAGRIVETGGTVEIARHATHPYTRGLLSSTFKERQDGERLKAIPGSPPTLSSLPTGCSFEPRCDVAMPHCTTSEPGLVPVGSSHSVRCVRCAPVFAPVGIPA